MSAIVLGKRSFFEELSNINNSSSAPSSSSSSPSLSSSVVSKSKRLRFSSYFSSSSSSSPSFNPFSSRSSHLVLQLASLFPDMDKQVLERALEECGDDLDSAIKSLNELRLGSVRPDDVSAAAQAGNAMPPPDGEVAPAQASLPVDGAEWVGLFVREMMSASDMDDARARASRALEALEKSICAREAAKNSSLQESMILKEQLQALIQENAILKRAVAIQHERQKESDNRSQELQQLKQLVAQYQEQVRTLEMNNFALTVHLKQAQQSSSIPGRFHPDVF